MSLFELATEDAMLGFGRELALACTPPCAIHLSGPLGAGKTTLVRGFLTALGHPGAVKSPTYTLVEPYVLPTALCYHFDFYRLQDAEELEAMGIRDYFAVDAFWLVEWPERGEGILPKADLRVLIDYGKGKQGGRRLSLQALSERGLSSIHRLSVSPDSSKDQYSDSP